VIAVLVTYSRRRSRIHQYLAAAPPSRMQLTRMVCRLRLRYNGRRPLNRCRGARHVHSCCRGYGEKPKRYADDPRRTATPWCRAFVGSTSRVVRLTRARDRVLTTTGPTGYARSGPASAGHTLPRLDELEVPRPRLHHAGQLRRPQTTRRCRSERPAILRPQPQPVWFTPFSGEVEKWPGTCNARTYHE